MLLIYYRLLHYFCLYATYLLPGARGRRVNSVVTCNEAISHEVIKNKFKVKEIDKNGTMIMKNTVQLVQ